MNLLIKKVKRSGHGFRNPDNYPSAAALALRRHLAHFTPSTTPRPATTLGCVETCVEPFLQWFLTVRRRVNRLVWALSSNLE